MFTDPVSTHKLYAGGCNLTLKMEYATILLI